MKRSPSVLLVSITIVVASATFSIAQQVQKPSSQAGSKFTVGPKEKIPVAFILTQDAVMIDFAGPWEVFENVMIESFGRTMDEQIPSACQAECR
jgi:hypothetical protein